MNRTENDLNRTLETQAEQFARRGGTTLEIDGVLARAGEIRRGRRMRATMVMAACVVALAVPTAVVVADSSHHNPRPTPAKQVKPDHSPLSLGDLETGATPRTGWFKDDIWHGPDGAESQWTGPDRITDVATLGKALLVATSQDGQGHAYLAPELTGDSAQVKSWPMEGGFAVSDKGNVAAFVQPNGVVVAVQDGGARSYELGKIPIGSGFTTVAVQGENCSGRSEDALCKVYVTTSDEQPLTYVVAPHDLVGEALDTGLRNTADVSMDDRYAGTVSVTDTGSCSQVRDSGFRSLWKTCDHRLLAFSPDGKHLLASGPYADGIGDGQLAILGSANGRALLVLTTAGQGVVTQMVWEDDSHVLATVFEQGRWAILRVGLDGSREFAVPPVKGTDDLASPFVLPST